MGRTQDVKIFEHAGGAYAMGSVYELEAGGPASPVLVTASSSDLDASVALGA